MSAKLRDSPADIAPQSRAEAATGFYPPRLSFLLGRVLIWVTLGALLMEALSLAGRVAVDLGRVGDVGYPDSAVLVILQGLLQDGRLFPPVDRPPYLVTLYGPLTYLVLAVPYAVAGWVGAEPVVGVRLVQLLLFAGCVGVLSALAARVAGGWKVAVLVALLAVAGPSLPFWVLQVRGDFLGLLLSLAAVGLALRGPGTRDFNVGAVLAGAAVLAKQTFISASVAIALWQLWERRPAAAARWVLLAAGTVAAGYALVLLREPAGLQHLAALRRPVMDYAGAADLIKTALLHVKVLYWPVGALILLRARSPSAIPLALYCILAWLVAVATVPQAGAAINYFWEPWFVCALLTGVALNSLGRLAGGLPAAVVLAVLLLHGRALVGSVLQSASALAGLPAHQERVERTNVRLEALREAVEGRRVLSSDPRIASWSSEPVVPDPFLTATLLQTGSWDPAHLLESVRRGSFDVVVGYGPENSTVYRGVHYWNPLTDAAVDHPYNVVCHVGDRAVWLADGSELLEPLRRAGCRTVP